jgi:hypothetical protein
MSQLTSKKPSIDMMDVASEHINCTSKPMNSNASKSIKLEAVHFGVKSVMFGTSLYRVLRDRGLELYLLIVPALVVVASL